MSLVRKIDGGWLGVSTGHHYYPPRECKESAEAQERQHARTIPLLPPNDVVVGSAEEAYYRCQLEALSNLEEADLRETILAYKEFAAAHPEFDGTNEHNSAEICEYLALKHGTRIVDFNGMRVPLATSPELWQEAFEWKVGQGRLHLNLSEQLRLEAQEAAKKAQEHRWDNPETAEAEMEQRADQQIARFRGGGRMFNEFKSRL